jgi:hypothetical protein
MSKRKISQSTIWIFLVILFGVQFLPKIFTGFDSHHDGLILTTVRFVREGLFTDSSWPFNQYGSFWAFPFAIISALFRPELSLVVLRSLTVIFYFITAFLVYKIARCFGSKNYAFLSVVLLFISEPFAAGFRTSLLPWPSALSMVVSTYICYALIMKDESFKNQNKLLYSSVTQGVLTMILVLTRIQIGVLNLIFIIIISFLYREKISLRGYFSGIAIAGVSFFSILAAKGWLLQSLYDEFIFGSSYISGDVSTYPTPKFTLLGVLIFLAFFAITLKLGNSNNLFREHAVRLSFVAFALLGSISVYYLHISRNLGFVDSITVLVRRFWITSSLAIFLVCSIYIVTSFFRNFRFQHREKPNYKTSILVGFSVISMSQVFPLFDQMHFWWGFSPGVVLFVHFISKLFDQAYIKKPNPILIQLVVASIGFATVTLPLTLDSLQPKAWFDAKNISYVTTSYLSSRPSPGETESLLQDFFHSNIVQKDRVLNLCHNSNVFFDPNFANTASRFFVYWPWLGNQEVISKDLKSSDPTIIVSCTLNLLQDRIQQSTQQQQAIIKTFESRIERSGEHIDINGITWKIYKLR